MSGPRINAFDLHLRLAKSVCTIGNALVAVAERWLFKRDRTHPSAILVYRHCFVGDFVVIIPALRRLRTSFPGARIILLTTSSAHRHWKGYGVDRDRFSIAKDCLDDVVEFKTDMRLGKLRQLRTKIKAMDLTHCLVLPFSSESLAGRLKKAVLLRALGVRRNVHVAATYGTLLVARDVQERAGVFVHQVDAPLHAVEDFIKRFGSMLVAPHKPSYDRAKPRALSNKVVFAPATKQANKQWPVEHFATLINQLLRSYPETEVDLIGGEGDVEIGKRIMELTDSARVTNQMGKLTLAESAELIRRARMFVGLDSGPMHIASLYDVPSVAIFPSIVPLHFWRPWGNDSAVVTNRTPCACCYVMDGSCPKGTFQCIRGISIESVFSEINRVWRSASQMAINA